MHVSTRCYPLAASDSRNLQEIERLPAWNCSWGLIRDVNVRKHTPYPNGVFSSIVLLAIDCKNVNKLSITT